MTRDTLNREYFDWMYNLVCDKQYIGDKSYRKLLDKFNRMEFIYDLQMDENRAEDGIDLRYRFGYEMEYEKRDIQKYLDIRPCSVLEMMAALALRCEEHIMWDPDIGDRTGLWFFNMVKNMKLDKMDDDNYNAKKVEQTVINMLNHAYKPNGEGGLFTVRNYREDLRYVEIWYQMCWYLDELE